MPRRASGGPEEVDIAAGARVRLRRRAIGLSQQELGARIGVTFQQVQKYERGANRISASKLTAIAQALDCSAAALLGAEDGDSVDTELLSLLAEDGAVDLLRAFSAIPDRDMRQAVISVAEGLGGGPVPRVMPRVRAVASSRS